MEMTHLPPEATARQEIDRRLAAAGWTVQHVSALNRFASVGVAVREFPMNRGYGRADYLLYVNGKALGVVEAKPEGATLTGVEIQSAKYSVGPSRESPVEINQMEPTIVRTSMSVTENQPSRSMRMLLPTTLFSRVSG